MTEQFSKGYDRGNYGNAYESQDWEEWAAKQDEVFPGAPTDFAEGAILGFFSSYELHEIADEECRDTVACLREKWKTHVALVD